MNKTTHHIALAVAFALATLTPTWGSFAEEGDQFSEDDLQPPTVEIPDSPPQSSYQACLALADYSFTLCIARGRHTWTCEEARRVTVGISCACQQDAQQQPRFCQRTPEAGCATELAQCHIEEQTRYQACLAQTPHFNCGAIFAINTATCQNDYGACLLAIPPLHMADVHPAHEPAENIG